MNHARNRISLFSSDARFGIIAIALHWSNALLMLGLFALGAYMTELKYLDPNYNISYRVHKSLGILVFELTLLQILWTISTYHPSPLAGHKPWEKAAARLVHLVLYGMMLLIPFSGYAISSAEGQGVDFFNWYTLPAMLPHREGLADTAGKVHYYLAYGTLVLVALHILAALKHQLIEQDGTLSRMLGICINR